MTGSTVVVFVSAGSCGTEWVAHGLSDSYRGIEVEHEPLGPLYRPRQYFRRYDDPEAILEVPEVASHVERVVHATVTYVETGWPLFPVVPLLAARVPDRLRVVHLTRHPVPSALSHLARRRYADSPRVDGYTRWATLGPTDPNVFQENYAEPWEWLSPYEKCLFWWTEVHLFALELPGRIETIPWLRVSAEEILSGDREALEQLLEFIGLPWRDHWLDHARRGADRWPHPTADPVDPLELHRHPTTVELARALGYETARLNVGALEARYRGQRHPALDPVSQI